MIAISHLTMRLAGGGHQITILDDVTLEIPDKQRVAIVGPSGSGKSTLLGLIAGLDRPTSGSITLNGVEISTMRENALARYRRDHIGYIFQSFHLIPTLTALENVLVPLELAGMRGAQDRATELLNTVGLGERLHHYPVQLQRHQDIFQRREGGNEVKGLENVADVIATIPRQGTLTHRRDFHAVQRDGAGSRPIQPRDEAQ